MDLNKLFIKITNSNEVAETKNSKNRIGASLVERSFVLCIF